MVCITEKAMLIALNVSQPSFKIQDREIARQVAAQHGADGNVGEYKKHSIAKEALAEVRGIAGDARTFHYAQTLPWLDKGFRILPAANYLPYKIKMREFKNAFESAVKRFAKAYPRYREEAKAFLKGICKIEDYPDPDSVAGLFSFDIDVAQIPKGDDFRVALGLDEEEKLKKEIDDKKDRAFEEATQDLWSRLHAAVSHMRDRLESYSVDSASGKVTAPFRDSLVENLRDLVDVLPRLNVTGDANLARTCQELRDSLCVSDAQALRDDPAARQKTAETAKAVADKMAGYMN